MFSTELSSSFAARAPVESPSGMAFGRLITEHVTISAAVAAILIKSLHMACLPKSVLVVAPQSTKSISSIDREFIDRWRELCRGPVVRLDPRAVRLV